MASVVAAEACGQCERVRANNPRREDVRRHDEVKENEKSVAASFATPCGSTLKRDARSSSVA
jgi:hypothetical protein